MHHDRITVQRSHIHCHVVLPQHQAVPCTRQHHQLFEVSYPGHLPGNDHSLVLSNDNIANIRKQKTIGIRKHNSEATKITGHAKDLDASSIDPPVKNTQGTSSNMYGSGDERLNQPGGRAEQHGDVCRNVEPRSYQDVVVNG